MNMRTIFSKWTVFGIAGLLLFAQCNNEGDRAEGGADPANDGGAERREHNGNDNGDNYEADTASYDDAM